MTPTPSITRIDSLLNELRSISLIDISTHNEIRDEMRELQLKGIINAAIYLHQGKYAYLIFPMVAGNRKRIYVGSDRKKIAYTEACIERGARHQELAQRLKMVDQQLANLAEELGTFVSLKIKETS